MRQHVDANLEPSTRKADGPPGPIPQTRIRLDGRRGSGFAKLTDEVQRQVNVLPWE